MSEATWIEFHDSYLCKLTLSSERLTLGVKAVVHRKAFGSAPASGTQHIELSFSGYTFSCADFSLDASLDTWIHEGVVSVDGRTIPDLLPSTYTYVGAVELAFTVSPTFQTIRILAKSVDVKPLEAARWCEER